MNDPRWWLLHPAAVHFPIALTAAAFAAAAWSAKRRRPEDLERLVTALTWAAMLTAWAALGLGLLAEETVPHVPPAWHTMHEHEELAWWTAGVLTALSLWRWRWAAKARPWFLAGLAAAVALILATGFHGGELVFTHGVGVGQ